MPRVARLDAGLIGLHRAIEGEELRILAEGFGEDAVALGLALAADSRRSAAAPRRRCTVDVCARRAPGLSCACWRAQRASFRRLALALGLHALEHRLACWPAGRSTRRSLHIDHRRCRSESASRFTSSRMRLISRERSSRTTAVKVASASTERTWPIDDRGELRVGARRCCSPPGRSAADRMMR